MRAAVAAFAGGALAFLGGVFLLVALLVGWEFGLAATLLVAGAAATTVGLLIIPADHNGRKRRS